MQVAKISNATVREVRLQAAFDEMPQCNRSRQDHTRGVANDAHEVEALKDLERQQLVEPASL